MKLTKPKSNEAFAKDPCPCGSGIIYGKCCKLKDFKWMKNESGDFSRSIPLSPEIGKVLEDARGKYKRIFGREPLEHDPIFVEKYLISIRDIKRETEDAMVNAGLRPELLYAYRKTGRLLTKENAKLLSDDEVKAWENAVKEYRKLKNSRMKEPKALVKLRNFIGELDSCIVLLGYFLENGINDDILACSVSPSNSLECGTIGYSVLLDVFPHFNLSIGL